MVLVWPSSRTLPGLTPVATPTGGSRARSAASCGLNPASPALPPYPGWSTTRSAVSVRWTPCAALAFSDAPITVNRAATATPTISADAVAAVRRGLRSALSRASRPLTPRSAAIGAPSTAAGRAATGPRTTNPASVATAPAMPRPPRPAAPAITAAAPPGESAGAGYRTGAGIRAGSAASSRSAASGGTREARTAGSTPASTVAATPTSTASTELDALNTRPPAGSAKPKPSKTPLSSAAMPMPPAQPTTDPTSRRRASRPARPR